MLESERKYAISCADTEPSIVCYPALESDQEITLRMVNVVLEAVESERPSGPDLEVCLDPTRRSEFPAAEEAVDVPRDSWVMSAIRMITG